MPTLYRKRLIPKECVLLKDDVILGMNEERIITKWNTLKPKKNLDHGYSIYFLKEGFKISRFLRADGSLLYWYCDIIKTDYDGATDTYVFTDLLADVIIYPDGTVKVVDIGEIAEAMEKDEISKDEILSLLKSIDKLLDIVYSGRLQEYAAEIERSEYL